MTSTHVPGHSPPGHPRVERTRLGVNIDHIATVRNARGGLHPDPVRAAVQAAAAGADGITAHLREDRRHIIDRDIIRLKAELSLPLNLEMAATADMHVIACQVQPHACCLVPEKRQEVTTEGGLDAAATVPHLRDYVAGLRAAGIRVSLFIDPEPRQLHAAQAIGAPVVELHTGTYCHATGIDRVRELLRIQDAAALAARLGLECHAGHGLDYDTTPAIAAIPNMAELNIGHFLVGEAIFVGWDVALRQMRALMDAARAEVQAGAG